MKKLYIVSTPIGNYDDISIRALNVLKEADIIVCEEFKPARRLLAHHKIEKELFEVNEHNEESASEEVLEFIKDNKQIAFISDCGTPLFSDPGRVIVDLCIQNNIEISPIPGASSLMAGLVGSGMNLDNFYYYGWLSPKKDIRRRELLNLRKRRDLIIIMETPYRLKKILNDIAASFGKKQKIVLCYKLTQKEEKYYRGEAGKILEIAEKNHLKGEFVLLVDNR